MACFHPLKGYVVGTLPSGKRDIKICSYESDHVELHTDGRWYVANTKDKSKYTVKVVSDYITIPCGKCVGCRLAYSRQWADRCMLESSYHTYNYFLTLTYDDNNLPLSESINQDTGEIIYNATLVKKDIQDFIKRLRRFCEYNVDENLHIKYFCAGEYGSQTFRPHYHMILYGFPINDLKLYKMSLDGYNYYNSATIDKLWKKGFVVISDVTWDTCAYTARYIMKKQYGSGAQIYKDYNILPEFTCMSTKPAIAKEYYEDNKDKIFDSDYIFLGTKEKSIQMKPPKYFEKLLEKENEDVFKERRDLHASLAEDFSSLRNLSTSHDYLGMLQMEEDNLNARIKTLKRKEF